MTRTISDTIEVATARRQERDTAAVSARDPDWSREAKRAWAWDPGRALIASLRAYERFMHGSRVDRWLLRGLAILRHRFWSTVTGAEVPLGCRIGGGLLLPHPNGVVIHPGTTIGPNCLIFQQVTLGTRSSLAGTPIIGGHVEIGAGARILGGVRIGDHATIGANAVVLRDVPSGATAVGVPARVLQQESSSCSQDTD
ncbi:MAG TPA: serine O-acetyltransferase [Caldimonas sp.]|jgi:serine O-acetyltransferase|nr:serine O-acetyltransferase [Caldimonas sp.]HEX2542206.1 serine O-acetyltransferase [Caldimonas sp.]